MDQQRPAVHDPVAPLGDVGTRRAVAMGAVDVQDVDGIVDVGVGVDGERAT